MFLWWARDEPHICLHRAHTTGFLKWMYVSVRERVTGSDLIQVWMSTVVQEKEEYCVEHQQEVLTPLDTEETA